MKKIDERQHIDLLKSEQAAFWAMWLILLISIIVQSYILERDVREYAWELAAFITGCVVSIFGTTRKGIWDTWLKPCMKNYFLASLAGTVVFTVIFVIGRYRNNEIFREDVMGTLVPATIIFCRSAVCYDFYGYGVDWCLFKTPGTENAECTGKRNGR